VSDPPTPTPRPRPVPSVESTGPRHRRAEVDTATPPGATDPVAADPAPPVEESAPRVAVPAWLRSSPPAAVEPDADPDDDAAPTGPLPLLTPDEAISLLAPFDAVPAAQQTPSPEAAAARVSSSDVAMPRSRRRAAFSLRVSPTSDVAAPVPRGDSVARRIGQAARDLVTGAAAAREQAELAAGAQLPVTTGRRIAVVSPRGGAGRTTVAALLACAFAARRADHVLIADAEPGLGSLAWRLDVSPPADPAALGPRLLAARAGTLADVDALLPATAAGLRVLPAGAGTTGEITQALSRFFAVTVIDGGGPPTPDAHAAVFVTPTTPDGVRSTAVALDQWRGAAVAVLVARERVARPPSGALEHAGLPVVRLPYDRHLAAGEVLRLDRLAAATHREVMRLAGLALRAALGVAA